MRKAEVAQQPPDRPTVPVGPNRHGGQFVDRQVPLLADPYGDPNLPARQLVMPTTVALP